MTTMPPQGRITDKTPDEWFNEVFPMLSMVLVANELVNLARKHNAKALAVKLDSEEAMREHASQGEETAHTMKLLKRVVDSVKRYGTEVRVVDDVHGLWRESVRRSVLISQESEAAAQFDLYLGPFEDFVTRLHHKLRTLLAEKLAEERHTNVDRMHATLLDCFG